MLENAKISYRYLIGIIAMTISPTAILYLPTLNYKEAKHDSWMSVIVVMVFGLLVVVLVTALGKMYPGKTIMQYSTDILGKVLGKIIGLVICLYFIYINATILREFAEMLAGPFMPNTNIMVFTIGIILPSIYALYKGFEVVARVNVIIFPIFMLSIFLIMLLGLENMDFTRLTPILEKGIEPVLKGAYRQLIWFGETFVLTMLIPYIDMPNKVRKISLIAVALVALLGVTINIDIVTTFGDRTETLTYPFLSLARYIQFGKFLERMDSLLMIIWIAGVFIKITIFYYCSVLGIAQLLNLKHYATPTIPVGICLVLLSSYLWPSLSAVKYELAYIAILPYTLVQFCIPLLLWTIASIKRRFSHEN